MMSPFSRFCLLFLLMLPCSIRAQYFAEPNFYMLGGKNYNPALLGTGKSGTVVNLQNGLVPVHFFYSRILSSYHFTSFSHTFKNQVSTLGAQAYFQRSFSNSFVLAASYTHAVALGKKWQLRTAIQPRMLSYFAGQPDQSGINGTGTNPERWSSYRSYFDLGASLHHKRFYFALMGTDIFQLRYRSGKVESLPSKVWIVAESGADFPLKWSLKKDWPLSVRPFIRYNSQYYPTTGVYLVGGPLLLGSAVSPGRNVAVFAGYYGKRFRAVYSYSPVYSAVVYSPGFAHELGLQFLIPRKGESAPDFYAGF